VKAELTRRFKSYNPVLLQRQVHQAVDELMTVYERKSLLASVRK
jgi:hypothetical protein